MPKTITKWSEIIGSQNEKRIIIDAISRDCLPYFSILTGNAGIGKSTFAKMIAKTILCTNRDKETGEPCGVCNQCTSVENLSGSSYIKVNMPSFFNKSSVNSKIEEIFKTSKQELKTVYILEELHGLSKDLQQIFLEELTRIPKDTWIISCTTRPYDILPDIMNRAVEFKLSDPSPKECERYAKTLAREYNISIESDKAIKALVEQCNYNPRQLSEVIRVVATDNSLTEDSIRLMFKLADDNAIIDYSNALFSEEDMYNYIKTITKLQESVSLYSLNRQLLDYLYEYTVAVAGGLSIDQTDLKLSVKKLFLRIFDGISKEKLVLAMTILGESNIREHENKSSQKSKLIKAKNTLERLLSKQTQSTQGLETQNVMAVKSTVKTTSVFTPPSTSTLIDNLPISTESEIDGVLVDCRFEDEVHHGQ